MLSRVLPLLFAVVAAHAATSVGTRFVDIFSPFRTDIAALSPDGKRLAYALRDGDTISIVTLEVDSPKRATSLVAVAKDKYALAYLQPDFQNNPARVQWMNWVSGNRLVVLSNMRFLTADNKRRGTLFGFDYDGANASLLHSGQQAMGGIAAFGVIAPDNQEVLMLSAGEWVAVHARTGKNRSLDEKAFNAIDAGVRAQAGQFAQREWTRSVELKKMFPGHEVTLFDPRGPSSRTLALVRSVADPGSFVVYDPEASKAWDFVRRAPQREGKRAYRIQPFDLTDKDGIHFTGSVVLPDNPRISRAPLILWMPENLGAQVRRDYHPEVEAFAEMGLAVAVVDGLHYLTQPESAALETGHRSFLPAYKLYADDVRRRPPPDWVPPAEQPRELDHQLKALDLIADHFPVSRHAVALFGQGRTARLALEASAARPGRFRCLVALDPQVESRLELNAASFSTFEETLRRLKTPPVESVFFLGLPRQFHSRHMRDDYRAARGAAQSLTAHGVAVDFTDLDDYYTAKQPEARAAVFRDIEAFLNEHLYRYSVKLGETQFEPVATP